MPKNKVKLAFISNYHARRTSLKKRKDSLKKKLNELCTLCDIEACAIMYSPNESHPDLWPSKEGVENVVDQFHKIPEMEQSKKMYNHDTYIKSRITKTEEQIKKHIKDNWESEMHNKMSECFSRERCISNLPITDLNDLVKFADQRVSEIESLIESLKSKPPAAVPPRDSQPLEPQTVVCGSNADNPGMAGGMAANGYVPVVENPGTFDAVETTDEWFSDWIDNMVDTFGSFSRG
ncbi:agamous-like MADS-box protein AGL80 [Lactuca sativa]|uniref:agamous-like MADS-box protein AGL80 n=1 Tax=Lactuca sativa TaxID=4236 RepID=UPI000CC03B71|nr:agamous-like MADS-box protein AGL80 [Lactuca sativa]